MLRIAQEMHVCFGAGRSFDAGFENNAACFSFSTRSLFSTTGGAGGSMRGGTRVAAFFCSCLSAASRCPRTSRPAASSRAWNKRPRPQPIAAKVQ